MIAFLSISLELEHMKDRAFQASIVISPTKLGMFSVKMLLKEQELRVKMKPTELLLFISLREPLLMP